MRETYFVPFDSDFRHESERFDIVNRYDLHSVEGSLKNQSIQFNIQLNLVDFSRLSNHDLQNMNYCIVDFFELVSRVHSQIRLTQDTTLTQAEAYLLISQEMSKVEQKIADILTGSIAEAIEE